MQSVQDLATAVQRVVTNVEKVIVGKAEPVAFSLIAVICHGHVLIEDVPGVGKTVLTKAIARSIGCTFKRIQFTPDLLPSDVTGLVPSWHKSCSPTKLTAQLQRPSQPCWKQWKNHR